MFARVSRVFACPCLMPTDNIMLVIRNERQRRACRRMSREERMGDEKTVSRRELLGMGLGLSGVAGSTLLAQAQPSAPAGSAYPKDKTALLIVDPYNDFMSEGG